ncbi:hypothetical protein GCM10028812_33730 [Ancylobacter sonchi]
MGRMEIEPPSSLMAGIFLRPARASRAHDAHAHREGRPRTAFPVADRDGKREGAYNRAEHMDRRREIAQAWADFLMEGQMPIAELVTLPRR